MAIAEIARPSTLSTPAAAPSSLPVPPGRLSRIAPLILGCLLFAVYWANRRELPICDSIPAKFLVVGLVRGDGVYLDRYLGHDDMDWGMAPGVRPWWAVPSRGHHVSSYPVAPALVAAPLAWPFVALFDARHPGWDRETGPTWRFNFLCKTSAAAVAATVGAVLLVLLRGLGLGRMALPAALACMLGSGLWSTASQTLWQHGPAALCLVLALWLTLPGDCPRWRLALGGLAAAAMVACRPTAAVFAAAMTAGVAWRRPRDLVPFLAGAAPVAALLASYNLHFFGSLAGGYVRDGNAYKPSTPLAAAVGTLFSPNRGLFVFSPWAALAVLAIPAAGRRLRAHPVVVAALAALPLHLAVVSVWPCWWAGHSFGPRFWTEAMPLFAVLLGAALADVRGGWRRWFLGAVAVALLWSVGVQEVGALCYPSSWNTARDTDRHPEACWDWRDTELSRCLVEGVKGKQW